MLIDLIKSYFQARFGVDSFKLEVKGSRIIINVLAIIFGIFGLIAVASLDQEFSFVDAIPAGFLLLISAVLFMFSD